MTLFSKRKTNESLRLTNKDKYIIKLEYSNILTVIGKSVKTLILKSKEKSIKYYYNCNFLLVYKYK